MASDPVYGNQGQKSERSSASTRVAYATSNSSCLACEREEHEVLSCERFAALQPEDRLQTAIRLRLCFVCLKGGHITRDCTSKMRCRVENCGRMHAATLHAANWSRLREQGRKRRERAVSEHNREAPAEEPSATGSVYHAQGRKDPPRDTVFTQESKVALPLVPVRVYSPECKCSHSTYALLDTGSNVTLCHERLLRTLGLQGCPETMSLTTLDKKHNWTPTRRISLDVTNPDGEGRLHLGQVYTRDSLPIDSRNRVTMSETARWSHLKGLPLHHAPIDEVMLLIGQDYPDALVPLATVPGGKGEPYAVRTRLGWTVNGPVNTSETRGEQQAFFTQSERHERLDQQVERVWKLESSELYNDSRAMSVRDKLATTGWEKTATYEDGHYTLPIPFRREEPRLPDNRQMAELRLRSLQGKLEKNPELSKRYAEGMEDSLSKGYAIEAALSEAERQDGEGWYLPHRTVVNPDKKKPQVVFDCAAQCFGASFNSKALQGPVTASEIQMEQQVFFAQREWHEQLDQNQERFREPESGGLHEDDQAMFARDKSITARWREMTVYDDGHRTLPILFRCEEPRTQDNERMAETRLNSVSEKLEEDARLSEEFAEGMRDPYGGMSPKDLEGEVITLLRQQLEERERLHDQDKTVREKLDRVRQPLIQKIEEFENQQTVDGDERRARSAPVEKLIENYSHWTRLVRTVACFESLARRDKSSESESRVGAPQLQQAEDSLIAHVQEQYYPDKLSALQEGREVPSSSSLYKFGPSLADGIIVATGRLTNASLPSRTKEPPIIPHEHPIAEKIVRFTHEKTAHSGREYVVAELRRKYWIIGVRGLVKRVLRKCIICKRQDARPCEQQMGDLPPDTVTPGGLAFMSVGVDYFGPIAVKRGRGREKRYGCLFTCLSSRAVHIEVVESLDVDSFINCLQRFIARRGLPELIRSDNGRNFVGAERELRQGLQAWEQEKIEGELSEKGVRWIFNTPTASHMGGVWERQIRSVRRILSRLTREQVMSSEVLTTLLVTAEGILNKRPLTAASSDPSDLEPLTPNHLLIHWPARAPPGLHDNGDSKREKRWRQVLHLADVFWHRWIREYLPLLRQRTKWQRPHRNVSRGDLVLVMDKQLPRNEWSTGRVVDVVEGQDGLVRTAEVRTRTGTFLRPMVKLCVLEEAAFRQ